VKYVRISLITSFPFENLDLFDLHFFNKTKTNVISFLYKKGNQNLVQRLSIGTNATFHRLLTIIKNNWCFDLILHFEIHVCLRGMVRFTMKFLRTIKKMHFYD